MNYRRGKEALDFGRLSMMLNYSEEKPSASNLKLRVEIRWQSRNRS